MLENTSEKNAKSQIVFSRCYFPLFPVEKNIQSGQPRLVCFIIMARPMVSEKPREKKASGAFFNTANKFPNTRKPSHRHNI